MDSRLLAGFLLGLYSALDLNGGLNVGQKKTLAYILIAYAGLPLIVNLNVWIFGRGPKLMPIFDNLVKLITFDAYEHVCRHVYLRGNGWYSSQKQMTAYHCTDGCIVTNLTSVAEDEQSQDVRNPAACFPFEFEKIFQLGFEPCRWIEGQCNTVGNWFDYNKELTFDLDKIFINMKYGKINEFYECEFRMGYKLYYHPIFLAAKFTRQGFKNAILLLTAQGGMDVLSTARHVWWRRTCVYHVETLQSQLRKLEVYDGVLTVAKCKLTGHID